MIGVLLCLEGELEVDLVRSISAGRDIAVQRRCADLTELLAAAEAGLGSVAIISGEVDGLTISTVERLEEAGMHTLVVSSAIEEFGPARVVPPDKTAILNRVAAVISKAASTSLATPSTESDKQESGEETPLGKIVVITSPIGSPGRTTLAAGIAGALAQRHSVLLIDADITAPSVAMTLGLDDFGAGIAAAARLADRGALDQMELDLIVEESAGFKVLTGLNRAHRWQEVPGGTISRILEVAATMFEWVVVDIAARTDPDESGTVFGPASDDVLEAILNNCDHQVLVGRADPIAIRRLLAAYGDEADRGPKPDTVAVTGTGVIPGMRERHVGDVVARFAHAKIVGIDFDAEGIAQALLEARPYEAVAISKLVDRITGERSYRSRKVMRK